jgi:hypothetical protein
MMRALYQPPLLSLESIKASTLNSTAAALAALALLFMCITLSRWQSFSSVPSGSSN